MHGSFIIHTSFYEPIKSLSDKQLGRIFRALFDYQLGNEVQVEDDIKMAFLFFKNQMDIDGQKYQQRVEINKQNGSKGGAPKGNNNARKKTTENNQNNQRLEKTTKTTLNDNDNDNVDDIATIPDGIDSSSSVVDDPTVEIKNLNAHTHESVPAKARTKKPPVEPMVVDLKNCTVSGDEWRKDFTAYQAGLRECYNVLRKDEAWIAERQELNPRVDIRLTLKKACVEYWGTKAGWEHKRKSKSKSIDWRATLTTSVGTKFNHVYENGTGTNQAGQNGGISAAKRADILRRLGGS